MPLQSIAAANMSICNSMMQPHADMQKPVDMPCHMHVANMAKATQAQHDAKHQDSRKANCAALCLAMNGATTIPTVIAPATPIFTSSFTGMADQSYDSVVHPNLLRPPISLT